MGPSVARADDTHERLYRQFDVERRYDDTDAYDERYPPDWDERRRAVYRRDDYVCQDCGARGGQGGSSELHAHHRTPLSRGGSNALGNVVTLCKSCHNDRHDHDITGDERFPVPSPRPDDRNPILEVLPDWAVGVVGLLTLPVLVPLAMAALVVATLPWSGAVTAVVDWNTPWAYVGVPVAGVYLGAAYAFPGVVGAGFTTVGVATVVFNGYWSLDAVLDGAGVVLVPGVVLLAVSAVRWVRE